MREMLEKICIDSIENYYKYGSTDFIEAIEDDIVWCGPFAGNVINGKDNLIRYFSSIRKTLSFDADSASATLIPLKADSLIVAVKYGLIACYPDGRVSKIDQNITVALRRKRDTDDKFRWTCPFIHISNSPIHSGAKKKKQLAEHDNNTVDEFIEERKTVRKLAFSGERNSNHYIAEDSIRYIEGGKGVQCYIHTDRETVTVNHLMKDVMKRLPSYYYRCHSSYIVNMRRIKSIGGYRITLESGEEIPVPAKKYSAVREYIEHWIKTAEDN